MGNELKIGIITNDKVLIKGLMRPEEGILCYNYEAFNLKTSSSPQKLNEILVNFFKNSCSIVILDCIMVNKFEINVWEMIINSLGRFNKVILINSNHRIRLEVAKFKNFYPSSLQKNITAFKNMRDAEILISIIRRTE